MQGAGEGTSPELPQGIRQEVGQGILALLVVDLARDLNIRFHFWTNSKVKMFCIWFVNLKVIMLRNISVRAVVHTVNRGIQDAVGGQQLKKKS